jgi:LysM repeat protein
VKNASSQFSRTFSKSHIGFLLLMLLLFSFVLAACERTVPRDDAPPDTPQQVEQPEQPEQPVDDPFAEPSDPVDTPQNGDEEPAEPAEDEADIPADAEESEEPPADEEPTAPAETPSTYTVQANDTLFRIAQRFGTTVDALARANNIVNVHRLDIGTVLTIPGVDDTPPPTEPGQEQIHVVQAGETFFRIAMRYGFTVDELASYNNIANPNRIDVGQQIRIPAR